MAPLSHCKRVRWLALEWGKGRLPVRNQKASVWFQWACRSCENKPGVLAAPAVRCASGRVTALMRQGTGTGRIRPFPLPTALCNELTAVLSYGGAGSRMPRLANPLAGSAPTVRSGNL